MAGQDKHIFAIYAPNVFAENDTIDSIKKIEDENVFHRLFKVLRLTTTEQIIFFDEKYHGLAEIIEISKKNFLVKIIHLQKNIQTDSQVTFFLPLLKKEALEEAIYSLSEVGISQIQLVITEKSRQKLLHEKEFKRLEAIIINAAEQSKNYVFPKIYEPIPLTEVQFNIEDSKIVFDPQGKSFFEIRNKTFNLNKISLIIGPEAGLYEKEIQFLENLDFEKCRLTPTILRAVQAATIGAALFKID